MKIYKFIENKLFNQEVILNYLLNDGFKLTIAKKNIDKINQFINYIFLNDKILKNVDDFGQVSVDATYAMNVLGRLNKKNENIYQNRYISRMLVELGFIENRVYNETNIIKKSDYRFTKKANDAGQVYLKENLNIEDQLDQQKNDIYTIDNKPFFNYVVKQLSNLSIDKQDITQQLLDVLNNPLTKNSFTQLRNSQDRIINYYFNLENNILVNFTNVRKFDNIEGKYKGRLYNFFSSTPRLIRKFYKYYNQPLIELDLTAAAPSLLIEIIDITNISTEELDLYFDYLTDNKLYNEVSEMYNLSLKDSKIKFQQDLLFNKNNKGNKCKVFFKDKFPNIYNEMNKVKKEIGSSGLANLIYDKEAELMLDTVLEECILRDLKVIPLHDAIFTIKEDLELVKMILEDSIKKVIKKTKIKFKIK